MVTLFSEISDEDKQHHKSFLETMKTRHNMTTEVLNNIIESLATLFW
jgi:hypothetical protein